MHVLYKVKDELRAKRADATLDLCVGVRETLITWWVVKPHLCAYTYKQCASAREE